MIMQRQPLPRAELKRKLVCVYSTELQMFEVRAITNKGKVSKQFAPITAFTQDVTKAFQRFRLAGIPFAGFRTVGGVKKEECGSWNEFIEAVWLKATRKAKKDFNTLKNTQ